MATRERFGRSRGRTLIDRTSQRGEASKSGRSFGAGRDATFVRFGRRFEANRPHNRNYQPSMWVEKGMSIVSLFQRARQLVDVPRTAGLLVRLYRDGRVPNWLKFAGVAAAVLIISPLDVFSDIPLLGPLDDIALLLMLTQFFIGMCPQGVVSELNAKGPYSASPAPGKAVKNVTPL